MPETSHGDLASSVRHLDSLGRLREHGGTIRLVALGLGWWAIAIAVLMARAAPATGYEASIYAATPTGAWIGIVGALIVGLVVAFASTPKGFRIGGLGLATAAILLIVCLPIVRGYRYLGEDDAMTHLGYARDIANGVIAPTEILYPAIHLHAIAIDAATGTGLESAMMLVAPTFVLAFVLSVALAIRALDVGSPGIGFGVVAALCLLPINGLAVHLQAHPSSMAILFLPAVLVVTLVAVDRPRPASIVLVALMAPTFVLLHPLHAANVVAMFVAVAGVVAITRMDQPLGTRGMVKMNPRMVGLVALGGIGSVLLAWIVFASVEQVAQFGSTIRHAFATGAPADTIRHYLGALSAIEGGIGELFVRLFLVSAVLSLLAGGLIATVLFGWYRSGRRPSHRSDRVVAYIGIGLFPIGAISLVFLVAGVDTFAFRQFGFAMALVTVVGAVALARIHDVIRRSLPAGTTTILTVGALIVLLVASMLVIYPSPAVYQPMGHVPDAQVSGYETTFEIRDDEVSYLHLRSLPHRYSDGIHGEAAHARVEFYGGERTAPAPDGFADRSLPDQLDEPRYLAITGADREREPNVFEGLRFDEGDFAYLDEDPRIDLVHSNDEFDLYLVRTDGPGAELVTTEGG